MRGYDGKLELVGWSDNSRYLASCTGNEVVLWDFARPRSRRHEAHRAERVTPNASTAFAWQPGGEHFVSGGRDWRLTLWRPARPRSPSTCRCSTRTSAPCAGRRTANALAVGEKKGRLTVFELVAR